MTAEQAERARRAKARAQSENRNLPVPIGYDHDTQDHDNDSQADDDFRADRDASRGRALGVGLGIFSIGLGLAEILAPKALSRFIGVKPTALASTTMRLYGVREIAAGVGMLLQPQRAEWAWARVAGDVLDISTLSRAAGKRRSNRPRIAAVTVATLGITALDVVRARQLSTAEARAGRDRPRRAKSDRNKSDGSIQVQRSVTVNRPIEEVYEFWRNFENLPQFMDHLESVQETGDGKSHWKAKAPAGTTVEWDAELTEDRANELIAWRSVEGARVENSGTVRFQAAPGDRGTEVHVNLEYQPPAGKLGAFVAKLFGEEPGQQIAGDMRRFKQVLETGEVLYSDASIHKGMHPAQPSDDSDDSEHDDDAGGFVNERADDAANQSSNQDRDTTTADDKRDDQYNNELANERSTF